jgi:glucosamine--fructose-6-phosphate aminotransferase (isomerizing)
MCGIAGVYGYNALRLSMLLTIGQLERGTLGTGVAYTVGHKVKTVKEPIHPIAFMRKYFSRFDPNVRVAISHNRQPSRGRAIYVNTHPFMACDKSFALIHNGTAFMGRSVEKEVKANHRVLGDTDSEIICHMLEGLYHESGNMVRALERLYETDFSGAILLVTRDGRIYGLRKGNNPLHYCVSGRHVFMASSDKAIENVVGNRATILSLKSGQIVEVKGLNVTVYDTAYVSDTDVDYGFDLADYMACDTSYAKAQHLGIWDYWFPNGYL